VNQKDFFKKMK